ncbi:MAG: hypothetical protein C5B53_08270 [Candidatus Melainabacteria bacterium]|nr:MAG: hypothetical protein C5B53_08270 [Candidatus Melainabacteria bacterium]
MKTRVAEPHDAARENRILPPDSLETALEKSIHELILLAKYYQKHGYLRQAQEIYYYILSIQERREKRKEPAKEGEKRNEEFQEPSSQNAKITNRRSSDPQLKKIGTTSAYGMCALKRS